MARQLHGGGDVYQQLHWPCWLDGTSVTHDVSLSTICWGKKGATAGGMTLSWWDSWSILLPAVWSRVLDLVDTCTWGKFFQGNFCTAKRRPSNPRFKAGRGCLIMSHRWNPWQKQALNLDRPALTAPAGLLKILKRQSLSQVLPCELKGFIGGSSFH